MDGSKGRRQLPTTTPALIGPSKCYSNMTPGEFLRSPAIWEGGANFATLPLCLYSSNVVSSLFSFSFRLTFL